MRHEALVVRRGLPACPLPVEGRRASDNAKARFGADTGPTKGCPRRPAIRPIDAFKAAKPEYPLNVDSGRSRGAKTRRWCTLGVSHYQGWLGGLPAPTNLTDAGDCSRSANATQRRHKGTFTLPFTATSQRVAPAPKCWALAANPDDRRNGAAGVLPVRLSLGLRNEAWRRRASERVPIASGGHADLTRSGCLDNVVEGLASSLCPPRPRLPISSPC